MNYLLFLVALTLPAWAQSHDELQVQRWKAAYVLPHRTKAVQLTVDRIVLHKNRYTAVGDVTGVPWYVIAGLHAMEASGSFFCHLHEGSSLKWRTRYVPKGRPLTGKPPFTWEYSAADAMVYDNMRSKNWAKLGPMLSACERYNGDGMRRYHPAVPTPYLWSFCGPTSIFRPGKYIADGKFSSTAVSGQVGIVPIWKELARRGVIATPSY